MKKYVLIVLSLLMSTMAARAQETYLNCDFENGIPQEFSLYDRDQCEPSNDVKGYGFEIGVPWVAYRLEAERNTVACSTSWYQKPATSDDWLVTTSFVVGDAKAILRWQAKASDRKHRDGYSVYISSKGNRPEDFDTSRPLFSTTAEEIEWIEHSLSLDDYAGQKVWVAFVNDSRDQSRLYIDNLWAGVPSSVYLLCDLGRVVGHSGEVEVSGVAWTDGEQPITGFTIGLVAEDGQTYMQRFDELTLSKGVRTPFTLDRKLNIRPSETISYALWIEDDTCHYEMSSLLSCYQQRVVMEENTGTWCAWCVRGLVWMDRMTERYPDTFIGIAVHNNDVMTLPVYDSGIAPYMGGRGFPRATLNRSVSLDPSDVEQYALDALAFPSLTDIHLSATYDPSFQRMETHTSVAFAESRFTSGCRLAYVVVENVVHQPGDNHYMQHNMYHDNLEGEMGGYESLPEWVPAAQMYYNDVARCVADDAVLGIEGSLPQQVEALVPVSHDYVFSLADATVFRPEQVQVVALLLDDDGTILNAARCTPQLVDYTPQTIMVENSTPALVKADTTLSVMGQIVTQQGDEISGLTVTLEAEGQSVTQTFADKSIVAGRTLSFEFPQALDIRQGESKPYTISVTAASTAIQASFEYHASSFTQRVVVEETTGTWCTWCVRGIAYMEQMHQLYPDTFIGIAVHNKDIMTNADYDQWIHDEVAISGYPSCVVNRWDAFVCDPSNLQQVLSSACALDHQAGVELNSRYDESSQMVDVEASVTFARPHRYEDYRLSYVIIENDVHQPGNNAYNQQNAYAGNRNGTMFGFEEMPEVIPSDQMYYQDVARCIEGPFGGIGGSLPSEIEAGQTYTHHVQFQLPESVLQADNAEVVALLIDDEGHIANAAKAPLDGSSSAIIRHVTDHRTSVVSRYTLFGQPLPTVGPARGIYFERLSDGTSRKMMVR